ncbi:hypothetical protein FRC07_009586 [Ceratobasidium sp. 392]|nr:hypothetical protein FRC07_009586 [Ceratobasidium sp. 392]
MKPRDFEIRLAGRHADNPVDGLLGIDQCTWPVRAEIVPLKGALELKKVEIEVVVYEYGEIRIKSSAQTSRDINVEKILYHGRVVVFDATKDTKSRASYIKITQPLTVAHRFEIPTTLPGAIKCHKDPASVVWKLNISVSRKNPGLFSRESSLVNYESDGNQQKLDIDDPHIESYEYSGARSFLPHTLTVRPYTLQGRDDRRGVAWAMEFPRSFFAAGECLSGRLTLQRFSAKKHVITRAAAIPSYGDVQEYRGSRSLIKSKISVEQAFGADNSLNAHPPTPDRISSQILHRVVIRTKSKHGVEFEHLAQFPLRIVAVAFEERVRLTAGKKLIEQPGTPVSDIFDPAPAYVEKLMGGGAYDPPPPFPVK